MKKKTIKALPDDLAEARQQLGRIRATLSELLDDSNIAKGKTWKRLNKLYQALDGAEKDLNRAQHDLEDALPKLLKAFEKER